MLSSCYPLDVSRVALTHLYVVVTVFAYLAVAGKVASREGMSVVWMMLVFEGALRCGLFLVYCGKLSLAVEDTCCGGMLAADEQVMHVVRRC